MSTTYYRLKPPFTHVTLEEGAHDKVSLWENGANVGTLTFSEGQGADFLCLLRAQPVMHTFYGGDTRGCVVEEKEIGLDADMTILDGSGTPTTVRDVRGLAGKGRKLEETP